MTESHDHNFKNLFLDFPEASLEFFFPKAIEQWGKIKNISFIRQEPKKHHLSDANLVLDMPILFEFATQSLLLWLVEFQEEKTRFSIHKLLRYTVDLMELYPDATVVPTVLFTDHKKWRTDVPRKLESKMADKVFLHFEYVFCKLSEFKAKNYYSVNNPVIKILLPKMDYTPSERTEVIRQAYSGLFQLASLALFEKYIYFIDSYAGMKPDEQAALFNELATHEETVMLADYIKNIGRQEGRQEGYNALANLIRNMKNNNLADQEIAKLTNIDINIVKKIINREPVEIPLHLLGEQ